MQQVVFRLLGPPEIRYKEQLIKIPRRRSRALLYYLVCTHAPQPRERLLALLCGDMDEESARHTFKTMLAEVRALLRGFDPTIEWIGGDDDQLRLNPVAPVWLDTEIFERSTAVTSRLLNRTIALYRGKFLDGFFLKDAPGFETWMRSTRDHFQHLYLSTLRRLAELYEADNQLEQAISCTQMLLATDPLMEEAYASLMRLYLMTGKRIEALREYERLCQVLAQELAVKPSASTRSLYEQIARSNRWLPALVPEQPVAFTITPVVAVQERPVPQTSVLAQTPFVGRAVELAWLNDHLLETEHACPLILLTGEAGVGKTRLLRESLAGSGASRLLLQGTCQEVEQGHAYHGLVEALRQGLTRAEVAHLSLPGIWRAQLALLLPDLFPSDAAMLEDIPTQPLAIAEALNAVFQQLARPQHPLVLWLDDLHWAEEATLALLGHLVRSVQSGSIFLLGSYCPLFEQGRLAPLRRSAARQNRLAELSLSPLSPAEVSRLVSLVLVNGRPGGPRTNYPGLAKWCYERSEGNPFFVLAWLENALAREQNVTPTPAIPETIAAAVSTQLAFLRQEARSLLTAAAFAGMLFDPLAVSELINMDKIACLAASAELVQKGLIIGDSSGEPGRYSFTHSSVKEVLLAAAGPLERYIFQREAPP